MSKRYTFRVCFFFFLLSLSVKSVFATQSKSQNVLFISSYNYDWSSVPYQLKGFSEEINSLNNVDYIFMDTKNVSYKEAEKIILSLINNNLQKFSSYDCIVAADDNALNFSLLYKKVYFGNAPIVFLGINNLDKAQQVAMAADVCGIIEKGYYQETIDLAIKIFPNAQQVVAITDNSLSAQGSKLQFEIATKKIGLPINYINTSLLTIDQISKQLSTFPVNSILILLNFKDDSEGNLYSLKQVSRFIYDKASVPCFRTDYPSIKYGLLGGIALKFDYMGQQAAILVNRYLSGEDMSSVGSVVTPGTICFNDEVIRKFNLHIPTEFLENAEILNPNISFFQKNYLQIILTFGFVFIVILLGGLFIAIKNMHIQKKQSVALLAANRDLQITYEQLKIVEADDQRANAVKTDFLARMSHDMRTPIGAIIGLSNFGIDENNDGTNHEYFKKIKNSSDYLLGLVNDILDMQKMETQNITLNKGIFNLSAIVEKIETIIKHRAEEKELYVIFSTKIEHNCEYGVLDDRRFAQVFINLLNNSVKYTPPQGTINFSFCTEQINGKIIITTIIKDTGVGMSTDFQKHMFEPFAKETNNLSQSEGGSGLGLAITTNLVELMGGTIVCESKLNYGTSFSVILPIESPTISEIKKVTTNKTNTIPRDFFNGKTVLLCEDNNINTEIAKKLLESKGFTVDCAKNGQIGLQKFTMSLMDIRKKRFYDVILMDIRMPIMNGLEASKEIRKLDNDIPIIALSANAYKEDIDKSLKAGMNAHLMKPIDSKKLFKELINYII